MVSVTTTSTRLYKFSISRFEAYKGQHQAYSRPRSQHQHQHQHQHQQSISKNQQHETQTKAHRDMRVEQDLKALHASFQPSRIAFLRDRIGHQLNFGLSFGKDENDVKDLSNAGAKAITHIPNVSKRYQDILTGRQRPLPRTKYVANQGWDGEQTHIVLNSVDTTSSTTAELTGTSLMNEGESSFGSNTMNVRKARMEMIKRRKFGMKLKLRFS